MENIVRYDNKINNISLRNFSDKELNIFFTILYKLKNKGINSTDIDFLELKKLSNGDMNNPRFYNSIQKLNTKLLNLNQTIIDENGIILQFNLFNNFRTDPTKKILTVEINKNFKFLFTDLIGNFTQFELAEIVSFKSSYSKNMYRLLKGNTNFHWVHIDLKDFKRILCIPEKYKMCDIDKVVLNPILRELTPVFPRLKLEKIKTGRKITKLKFTWTGKKIKQAKLIEIEIVISKEMEKSIEKAKKNKYLNLVLTKVNLKNLLEIFNEKILINAFQKAYIETKKDINFNYLKKYIENSLQQKEIKFVVGTPSEKTETIEKVSKPLKIEIRESEDAVKMKAMKHDVFKTLVKQENYEAIGRLGEVHSLEQMNQFLEKLGLDKS